MNLLLKATLSAGLANVKVDLIEVHPLENLCIKIVHNRCNSTILYQNWCPECSMKIELSDIIKVIKLNNEYIKFIEQTHNNTNVHIIEINHFLDRSQIEPNKYKKHYYLVPSNCQDNAYYFLIALISNLNKIAIGKISLSDETYTCAIHAYEGGILLTTLNNNYGLDKSNSFPINRESTKSMPGYPKELIL